MSDGPGRPALILGLALVVALIGMAPGFGGDYRRSWLGHNGARYTHIARNHARWGMADGGAPLLLTEGEPRGPQASYLHHPPGVGWLLGGVFTLTGVDEDVARGVSALASLLALVLLARLVASVSTPATGAGAALVAACLPMTWVFGTHVEVQGPHVLAAGLAALLATRRAVRGGPLLPALALTALAGLFDWYGLYLPVLGGLLTRPRGAPGGRRKGLIVAGGAVAVFAALTLWLGTRPGAPGPALLLAAAGERAPAALAEGTGAHVASWFRQVHALLPGWPLLLVALGAWIARSSGGERQRLVLQLLLAPLIHAALFPAGMLQHNYWLFGLGPALGAGVALGLAGRGRLLAALAGALALSGALLREQALAPEDPLPALMGRSLRAEVPVGEWVLTNYDTNVLLPGAAGDRFVMMRPEVTFYADRPIRGGIASAAALDDALERLPLARWFLAVPWPREPDAALTARLAELARGEPRVLSTEPLVRLVRLAD